MRDRRRAKVLAYAVECEEYVTPGYATREDAEAHLWSILDHGACPWPHRIIEVRVLSLASMPAEVVTPTEDWQRKAARVRLRVGGSRSG